MTLFNAEKTVRDTGFHGQWDRTTRKNMDRNGYSLANTRNVEMVGAAMAYGDDVPPDSSVALLSLFHPASAQHDYRPNSTIILHGYPADAIYLIVSGTVRCCTINEDGDRQIFRFAGAGDIIGVSDANTWHFTAEAINNVVLKSVTRKAFEQAVSTDRKLSQEVRAYISNQLASRERQLLALVAEKASERLLRFLRDFSYGRDKSGFIVLPMCRRDIADHLGMSAETVSRCFTALKIHHRIDLDCAERFRVLDASEAV